MRNILTFAIVLCSLNAMAVVPRYNTDPYSHRYTAIQTFDAGLTATTVAATGVTAATVTAPITQTTATGGNDDILFKPAGALAMTIAENGNVTIVGDLTANNTTTVGYTSTTGDVTSSGSGAVATTLAKSLASATNFVYDIDSDANSTTEFFKITHNAGTVLLNITENGALFQEIKTVQPTCNAAAGGAVITYIKGSGGTEATSKCACEEVAGVYAWTAMSATGDCT